MIKFGRMSNLIYPLLFVIALWLRRLTKFFLVFKKWIYFESPFLLALIMFISEFAIGGIISYVIFYKDDDKLEKEEKEENNTKNEHKKYLLITKKKDYIPPDSNTKIIFLLILAAIVEFIGAITRRYLIEEIADYESEKINIRLRSFEIILSSFLCYFILGNEFKNVKKHHFITLVIITISLICSLILEFVFYNNIRFILDGLLFLFISSLTRSILDIIEKYLLDTDFINVYKMTAFEGMLDTIISLFCYSFKPPRNEIIELFKKEKIYIIIVIILLIIYGILSFFKNIFRRISLAFYSPMTRALAESILDPFIVIYEFFNYKYNFEEIDDQDKYYNYPKMIHLILIFIFTLIMVICSCFYNEFLIINCCKEDTFYEIDKRGIQEKIDIGED